MAEKIIQNPSITINDFEYDSETGYVSAISGHPLAGQGGGTIEKSDLMWKPTVGSDGYVRWSLASSATQPDAAYISGAQGPQGNPGTNGTNGTDGISPTFTITPTAGGTHVVLSGAQGEESFDVLSGAAGAKGQDGANGFSPTVSTATVNADASHTNGGVQVDITYKDGSTTATASYTAWNGNNGEGFVEASHYQSLSAGYADYARFSDNSVSSMDQLKGSIDWGNGIAGEYQTHSGDFVTSSSQTITGDKQYALTTAGWAEIDIPEAGGEYLPLSGGTVSGSTYFSAANGQNMLAVASAASLIGASRQAEANFGQNNNAMGTTWLGVGGAGMYRGFLKYTQGGNVGDLDSNNTMQVEFTPSNKGQIFAKAKNNGTDCPETQILNPTKASCDAMTQSANANLISGPNYMLAKNADGQFVIGAACINCTAINDVTLAPNTYYFVYEV